MLTNGQTKPSSFPVPSRVFIQLPKINEQLFEPLLRNAHTSVDHTDLDIQKLLLSFDVFMVFIILLFDTFFGDRVILQEFLLNRFVYDIIMLADGILVATNKVYDAFVRHFLRLRNLRERAQGHRGVFGVALVHNQLLVKNLYFHSDSAAWICEFEGV